MCRASSTALVIVRAKTRTSASCANVGARNCARPGGIFASGIITHKKTGISTDTSIPRVDSQRLAEGRNGCSTHWISSATSAATLRHETSNEEDQEFLRHDKSLAGRWRPGGRRCLLAAG